MSSVNDINYWNEAVLKNIKTVFCINLYIVLYYSSIVNHWFCLILIVKSKFNIKSTFGLFRVIWITKFDESVSRSIKLPNWFQNMSVQWWKALHFIPLDPVSRSTGPNESRSSLLVYAEEISLPRRKKSLRRIIDLFLR